MKKAQYINPLNKSFRLFFREALRISLKNPAQSLYFLRAMRNQQRAAKVRAGYARQGLHVPPIMIFSVTDRCNLRCKGCFHRAMRNPGQGEMSEGKLRSAVAEARDLGVFFMVLIGGEPLVRPDILRITRDFPDIMFFLFTNGLLVTDEMATGFRTQKNIVPILSIEGYACETDNRRGDGVYQRIQDAIRSLKRSGVFFGASITVTRDNFKTVTGEQFVSDMTGLGCKLVLFAEYTPIQEGTEQWVITDEQRNKLVRLVDDFRAKYPAFFVSSPNDEKEFGGCLSAGRGFVHINAQGDVEPCPFVPYSDTNLGEKPLREALQSRFLKAIRENEDLPGETEGGCALWTRRDWVQSLLKSN